jgi:transcriptional regulator with XRE-family HTH domain
MRVNHAELGDFLKSRRGRVQPADVGLPDGSRRRVPGLRRDEVARLADMSVDYYIELEQGRGQSPSPQILTALGRALRLDGDELAHLMHLAGHKVPLGAEPVKMQAALSQLLAQLEDTPALVITDLHQVLVQNRLSQALIGPLATGLGRDANFAVRWFADPAMRELFAAEEREDQSRVLVSDLRAAAARRGQDRASVALIAELRRIPEFVALWDAHEVAVPQAEIKRIVHPSLGVVEVTRSTFYTADAAQRLMWMVPADAGIIERLREMDAWEVWAARRPAPGAAVTNPATDPAPR